MLLLYYQIRRFFSIITTLLYLQVAYLIHKIILVEHTSIIKQKIYQFIFFLVGGSSRVSPFSIQLRSTFEKLGPTFVKLGQLLALKENIISEDIALELRKLQNQVVPINYPFIKNIIENELQQPIENIFIDIDKKPIASGSLAQVYKATLKNYKEVVIKVQKPYIYQEVLADIKILKFISTLFMQLSIFTKYKHSELIEEFSSYTKRELNFIYEANNLRKSKKLLSHIKRLIIPKVYLKYSTSKLITMDYVPGIHLDKLKDLEKKGIHTTQILQTFTKTIVEMMFTHGYFHADLHLGNIKVVGMSNIALLDFGIMGYLSNRVQKNLCAYIYFMLKNEYETALEYLLRLVVLTTNSDIINFRGRVSDLLREWYHSKDLAPSLGKFILDIMKIADTYDISFDKDLILGAKTITTLEGVFKVMQVNTKIQLADLIRPYIIKIYSSLFKINNVKDVFMDVSPDLANMLLQLPKNIHNFFEVYKYGILDVKTGSLNKAEDQKKHYLKSTIYSSSFLLAGVLTWTSTNPVLQKSFYLFADISIPIMSGLFLSVSFFYFLKSCLKKTTYIV